jgi:hypothetical protein
MGITQNIESAKAQKDLGGAQRTIAEHERYVLNQSLRTLIYRRAGVARKQLGEELTERPRPLRLLPVKPEHHVEALSAPLRR